MLRHQLSRRPVAACAARRTPPPATLAFSRSARTSASVTAAAGGAALQETYPLAVVDQLDSSRPHAAHLLGTQLVLWRDATGSWRAHEDKCPHRLAPLSEGRIESDGTLQCAYHGWTFDGSGACTHIPQLRGDDKAQGVACASRKSCLRSYPCQELHGLLWVLQDSSEAGWKQAAAMPTPATAPPELTPSSGWAQYLTWYMRDLPLRYDTIMENFFDPTHVPFAHHGVQSKRSTEQGTQMSLKAQERDTITADYRFGPAAPTTTITFQAPNFVRYDFGPSQLLIYTTPTQPGWVRVIYGYVRDTRVKPKTPSWSGWLGHAMLQLMAERPWIDHLINRHSTLDGDTYFLHQAERTLLAQKNDWRAAYFMPAQADRWLDERGGAVPTCELGTPMPPQMTKRQVLDRYSQHTQHCKHCQQALKNAEAAAAVLAACGALAALWLVARGVAGLPLLAPATGLGLLAVTACGWGAAALAALRQKFFFEDYVHADK
ncbi:Pheophorbide a oxygenase, chloroplastic [Tetrabaena socialis]|uniref:Pheophorbide a oxygenase, chloroplastic n=1 Tax=Tetrabaena socialis TaxID=47790 RepID=A0A2J8ADV2_9CHLO|nr:Pheophorbide a oxygenase, chloroplastic [Tetrabaena socialis]|eukprot:PNH10689.1 Pheophorbide a oxygenase, chloroplastic [Tetrabaena socialis]